MADGSVFLQYHDREHNIKMIILIIFADVNIVVKKRNIIATDYEKVNNTTGGTYKIGNQKYSRSVQ